MPDEKEEKPVKIEELDERIRTMRRDVSNNSVHKTKGELPPSLAGIAARAGVELVAGVAVGAGAGYGLDLWLNSSPWMLIVCFILGAAAGMMNVYRAVNGMGMSVGYGNTRAKTDLKREE
jgi:ATP synthase protein I